MPGGCKRKLIKGEKQTMAGAGGRDCGGNSRRADSASWESIGS